jgi:hypothetical protein
MSKLTKVVLGVLAATLALSFIHAWLNLGFDPLRAVGLKQEEAAESRFRVGFLPVT